MIYQTVSALHTISDPHSVLHVLDKKSSDASIMAPNPLGEIGHTPFIANTPTPIVRVQDRPWREDRLTASPAIGHLSDACWVPEAIKRMYHC